MLARSKLTRYRVCLSSLQYTPLIALAMETYRMKILLNFLETRTLLIQQKITENRRSACVQITHRKLGMVSIRPGFHYTANATTTTQKQSDYKVEQSSFTLIEIGRCCGRNWLNGNQVLSQLRPRQRPSSSQNKAISMKDDCSSL